VITNYKFSPPGPKFGRLLSMPASFVESGHPRADIEEVANS
jgi:hypothetical protein